MYISNTESLHVPLIAAHSPNPAKRVPNLIRALAIIQLICKCAPKRKAREARVNICKRPKMLVR